MHIVQMTPSAIVCFHNAHLLNQHPDERLSAPFAHSEPDGGCHRRIGEFLMRCAVSVLLLFAVVVPGWADPPKVPKKVEGKVGQITRIVVTVPEKTEIGYQPAFDDSSPDIVFDELIPRANQRRFFIQATQAGTYPIVFWTKGETTGTVCLVVIGGSSPPPPPPLPHVDPDPALVNKFKTAIGKDELVLAGARDIAAKLAQVYLTGAKKLRDTAEGDDPKTVGALYTSLFKASEAAGIPRLPTLTATRSVITDLGTFQESAELRGDMKAKILEVVTKIGVNLQEAAK
jgi:hypothetical protein